MSIPPPPFKEPIYVTKPFLPPLSAYMARLESVWKSGWLANNGQQHQALEQALSAYLGAPLLSLFNNGTIALIVACQALRLSGEVITTPFTFPATPHVLSWNNITPVFADIDPVTLNIDPRGIEARITPRTSAILAVHVYGVPCEVEAIQDIADFYGLKVVYDAAHAFGAAINGKPISAFGDATMFSFHATKLFHTAEGGALAVTDPALKHRIDLLKNFGIKNETEVVMPGINGKMNELQAALGLAVLEHLEQELAARQRVAAIYKARLGNVPGLSVMEAPATVRNSYQYFIIRINADNPAGNRDFIYEELKKFNIFARKYFYPLCSEYNCYRQLPSAAPAALPVAHRAAVEVLALPFYGSLSDEDAHRICDAIRYVMA
jgi:dTDP-4-amino-4,6-dideoxygalactose transaminase